MAIVDSLGTDPLIKTVTNFVRDYMSNYDASHDFGHIQRVVGQAHYIYTKEVTTNPALDLQTVVLAGLLHDVGDRKYLKPGEDASTMVRQILLDKGASEELAQKVQTICLGVSYSSEIKDLAKVQDLIMAHPELAVVQDADRLDAIGAIGVGRCFTYGGAKTGRSMDDSIEHFEEKLLLIEDMMKTDTGRKLAKERSDRLRLFREWWRDESSFLETPVLN